MTTLTDPRIQRIETGVRRPADLRANGWHTTSIEVFMAREGIPGASVAVIDQGEVAWARSYGVMEAGKDAPVTAETRFQAASISKPVAVLTALSLVHEGRLALDEDIHAYQVSWKLPANGGWLPRVTLRQLFSHSGGITVGGFPGYTQEAKLPTLIQILNGEPPANTPPIFADTLPGLQFRYSGGGYTILQRLLEDVSGRPFWQLAQERVLEPAGMHHSTFRLPLPEELRPFAAAGHRAGGLPIPGGWHLYPEAAAAGLWSTPLDLARLALLLENTLAGKEETLLRRALVEEMLTPQIRTSGISLQGWDGLGLFLTREGDDWYFGHGGSNEGFRCSMIAHKGKGQAVVTMTNSDTGWMFNEAFEAAVAVEYGWPGFAWTPPTPADLAPGTVERFCGAYRMDDGRLLQVYETASGLALEWPNQPPLAMVPKGADRFYLAQLNVEVTFQAYGQVVTGLELVQNGANFPAKRLRP